MIELKNIRKIYKTGETEFSALDNVSLSIKQGDFIAIQGASGSGKTTLLNILGCLDTFDDGQYTLHGKDVSKMNDEMKAAVRNKEIGFVLQDFALINTETVEFNVKLPLLFSKVPFNKISRKAAKALSVVGLSDQSKKLANQLSGGQRQRVAIARAIVNSPSIILADEPTGQLDSATGRQIMELLTTLNQNGATIIMVTHDDNVAKYASRRILLSDGKIVHEDILT